jgi:hypothetical protein
MLNKTLAALSVVALTMSPLAALAQVELAEDVAAQLQNLGYQPDELGMLTEDQVQPMVRKSIEQHAREQGYAAIDLSVMDEEKGHMGM